MLIIRARGRFSQFPGFSPFQVTSFNPCQQNKGLARSTKRSEVIAINQEKLGKASLDCISEHLDWKTSQERNAKCWAQPSSLARSTKRSEATAINREKLGKASLNCISEHLDWKTIQERNAKCWARRHQPFQPAKHRLSRWDWCWSILPKSVRILRGWQSDANGYNHPLLSFGRAFSQSEADKWSETSQSQTNFVSEAPRENSELSYTVQWFLSS